MYEELYHIVCLLIVYYNEFFPYLISGIRKDFHWPYVTLRSRIRFSYILIVIIVDNQVNICIERVFVVGKRYEKFSVI